MYIKTAMTLLFLQARVRRLAALNRYKRPSLSMQERDRLRVALETTAYISSEESGSDHEEENSAEETRKLFIVRKLPWRSNFLNEWFEELDKRAKTRRENRACGAVFVTRRKGPDSERKQPEDAPEWAVQQFEDP